LKLPVSARQLEKMKLEMRGNPQKIAQYNVAKRMYDDMIELYFNEEFPYAHTPSEDYVERLKERAKSGNTEDVMRYEIMKERRDMHEYEASGQDARDIRLLRQDLVTKLTNGEKLSQGDIRAARELVLRFGSIDNQVLYSRIKRTYEQQQTGEVEKVEDKPSDVSITKEMVDEAYQRAKTTGRIEDSARYAILKRNYEQQASE
jgi:hypothetical protein